MSVVAFVRFNLKSLGNNISTDSGIQTKDNGIGDANLKLISLEHLTSNTIGFGVSVNDIIVYGGASLKSGNCIGYCYLKYNGQRYVFGVTSFHAVRTGQNAYIRLAFVNHSFNSQYFIENGP